MDLSVLMADFNITFGEILHDKNDNVEFVHSGNSMNSFCSAPVPLYYEIKRRMSFEKIYERRSGSLPCPKGKSTLHWNELYCMKVDEELMSLFDILKVKTKDDFIFFENPRLCASLKKKCEICRNRCSEQARNNNQCKGSGHNQHATKYKLNRCYDKCENRQCNCPNPNVCFCKQYEINKCLQKRTMCAGGFPSIISLIPMFAKDAIYCHVKLLRLASYKIRSDLIVSGVKTRTLVHSAGLLKRVKKNSRLEDDHGYLKIGKPDSLHVGDKRALLLKQDIFNKKYILGYYGVRSKPFYGKADSLIIRPNIPFGINSGSWGRLNCSKVDLDELVVLGKPYSVHSFTRPFTHLRNVEVNRFDMEHNITKIGNLYKTHQRGAKKFLTFRMPANRSVFRYFYPKTKILNDHTLNGDLYSNRTFWTIRVSGKLSSCPGYFTIKLYDQDNLKTLIYHYDLAINDNKKCKFSVSLHLPSKGKTNILDKMFIMYLENGKQIIKLLLVSPKRIPKLAAPIHIDKVDTKKLQKILSPLSIAAGVMLLLLVILIIYGYRTKPKDAFHRDRDNALHFRHVLFVIWFVGARLAKTFLVTIAFLSYVFVIIHHKNYQTLKMYPSFKKLEDMAFVREFHEMEVHRVKELQRQAILLTKGKRHCEMKMKMLDLYLEQHEKKKYRQQEEKRKKKCIRVLALDRIQGNYDEKIKQFDRKRKNFNDLLTTQCSQINNQVNGIKGKVSSSTWLKPAKILYKLAKIFSFGTMNEGFLSWVGLEYNFGGLNYKYQMPSFTSDFEQFRGRLKEIRSAGVGKACSVKDADMDSFTKEMRTELEKKMKEKKGNMRTKLPTKQTVRVRAPITKQRAKSLLGITWISKFMKSKVTLFLLASLDILLFVFRNTRTYMLAILLLYGFPKVIDIDMLREQNKREERTRKTKLQSSNHLHPNSKNNNTLGLTSANRG